jgi:hypothetical protein
MEMSTSAQRKLVDVGRRGHVGDLLERYPAVSADEVAEILRYIKKGPPLEVALLSTDDRIKPRLDQLRHDHRSEFSLGPKEYMAVALIVAALVAFLAFLWDSGLGR